MACALMPSTHDARVHTHVHAPVRKCGGGTLARRKVEAAVGAIALGSLHPTEMATAVHPSQAHLPGVTVVGPRRTLPSRMITRSNAMSTIISPTHTPMSAQPSGGSRRGSSHRAESARMCEATLLATSGHTGQPTMRRIQAVLTTSETAQPASAHFWCAVSGIEERLIARLTASPADCGLQGNGGCFF
jgi:hypothetical protein